MRKVKHIVVLSTIIQGKRNFIAQNISIRSDNKAVVTYTKWPEEAREFDNGKEAYAFIDRIVNPFERIIQVEQVVVDVEVRKRSLEKAMEALQEVLV